MKTSTDCSGLQGSAEPSHASGGTRRTIRRIPRQKPDTSNGGEKAPRRLSRRVPSLGRPVYDECNGTQTDPSDPIPTILREHEGRNDKIHINCELCTVTCENEEDAQDFIFHLGGPPSDQRSDVRQFSRLFKTASRQGRCFQLKTRSKPFAFGDGSLQPPLITGSKLKFRKARRNDGKTSIFITAELFLNVNRALNHQRERLANQQDGAIFKSLNPIQRLPHEMDNVAPLELPPNEHDNARREYIKQTFGALMADVRRAASVSDASGSQGIIVSGRPNAFSLWEVETCWDVGGAGFDASLALDSIVSAVREWGGRRGWEGNEGSITTQFSDSEWLVIYAKADNRLRFEIRHRPTRGKQSYTAPSIIGLIAKIDEFRRLAAHRINGLWLHLRPRLTAPVRLRDWTQPLRCNGALAVAIPRHPRPF